MSIENESMFPMVDRPELDFLRDELSGPMEDAGISREDLVCVYNPWRKRYAVSVVTNADRNEFWVLSNFSDGEFNRDHFEHVWFNLDRAKRANGIKNWVEDNLRQEREIHSQEIESFRERNSFISFLMRSGKLPHSISRKHLERIL